jgi:hypothetical protein
MKKSFLGKGGLLSGLNQRLFMVKRMSNHVSKKRLQRIVDTLWTCKLRYGLQLCSEVRLTEDQPKYQVVTMEQRAKKNALSPGWSTDCGSKKHKNFVGGTKYAVSNSDGSTNQTNEDVESLK